MLPTGALMAQRFAPLGLYRARSEIPPAAARQLRRMVLTELAVRRVSMLAMA